MWLLWSSSLWIKRTSHLLHLIPTHPLNGGTGSGLKQSALPWTQWRNGDKCHWFCFQGATVLPIAPDFWFCLLRIPYYSFLKLLLMKKKNAPSGLYSFHCTLQTGINVNAWRLFKASDRRIFFSPGLWFCWQSPCPRRHSQLLIYFFHSISCIGNHTENSLLIMIFRPDLFICFITTTPSSSPILVMNFLKLSTIMVRVGSPHPQADLCHRAEFYWAFVT